MVRVQDDMRSRDVAQDRSDFSQGSDDGESRGKSWRHGKTGCLACQDLKPRYLQAMATLGADAQHFLVLGELPRGIGYGIIAELMRRGLAEMGISEKFRGKGGWRITALGLECLAFRSTDMKATDRKASDRPRADTPIALRPLTGLWSS